MAWWDISRQAEFSWIPVRYASFDSKKLDTILRMQSGGLAFVSATNFN